MELQYVKNHSLKALSTFYAPSLLSLMCGGLSWLGCGSIETHEPESARPVQPCGAPGETGCGLTCSILPSSSSQRLASLPDIPTHRLECQPVSSTGNWVWQCWLQGSDGPLMGPSAQQPHEGRQGGWGRQVCLCSTCCPPHRGQDRCLWHWFWKRQRRRQREISGQGMEGEKGKCNVTVWNLISKICSIKINRGFLWDAESRKGFLSIHKPVHVISSTNIYSALG